MSILNKHSKELTLISKCSGQEHRPTPRKPKTAVLLFGFHYLITTLKKPNTIWLSYNKSLSLVLLQLKVSTHKGMR